jgi:hypothetical protein
MKNSVAICTTALFAAFPVWLNQWRAPHTGHGHAYGHDKNNQSLRHDDDGNSAGHRQDRPHGFGDRG